jgi:hypothetical protein|tara:strand:- start:304 stop:663 length:360 start_codon:yes stop_codon:yes gene_type:complete
MKNVIIILFQLLIFSIISCEDKELTPQQAIIGTWVGTEFPQQDSIIFYQDNKSKTVGRAGSGDLQNFSIDNQIIIFSTQSSSSQHNYNFSDGGNKVYIKNMRITIDMQDDGGIEYQKSK